MDVAAAGYRNVEGEKGARQKLACDGLKAVDAANNWQAKVDSADQYLGAIARMNESPGSHYVAEAALKTPRSDVYATWAAGHGALSVLRGDLGDNIEHSLAVAAHTASDNSAQVRQGLATRGFFEKMVEVAPKSGYADAARAALAVDPVRPLAQGAASAATAAALAAGPSGPISQVLARMAGCAMDAATQDWNDKNAAARPFLESVAQHTEDWTRSQVAAAALHASKDVYMQYATYRGALQVLAGDVSGTADQALADAAEHARNLASAGERATGASAPFLQFIPKS